MNRLAKISDVLRIIVIALLVGVFGLQGYRHFAHPTIGERSHALADNGSGTFYFVDNKTHLFLSEMHPGILDPDFKIKGWFVYLPGPQKTAFFSDRDDAIRWTVAQPIVRNPKQVR